MKQFSFFKNNTGISGLIRADQISAFLGGRVNPASGYENDICVYTKCYPPDNFPERSYYDINDHWPFIEWANAHPKIKVIAISRIAQRYIMNMVDRADIIFIPQHHCNFDRESRNRKEVITAGIIGGRRSYELNHNKLAKSLKEIGIDYVECIHPQTREQVVDFYKRIDIQIVFRPRRSLDQRAGRLSSSLKLANACSFGIPTVSYPEDSFVDEFDGCFISVKTEVDLISSVRRLMIDKGLYEHLSIKSKEISEKYHIENIANLYKELL